MALGPQLISDLAALKRAGHIPTGGRVVEIGAQQLSNPFLRPNDRLNELYRLFGRTPICLGDVPRSGDLGPVDFDRGVEPLPDAAPSSRLFWESLGLSYAAVEYSGHRDSIPLDLNRDSVPRRLQSSFDLVVNAGTTEHVANQDNAFRVIHDLASPGGLMIHDVPASGMMTHGILGYNLQFFFVLCRDNRYEVLDLGLVNCGSTVIHADIIGSNAQFARLPSHSDTRYGQPIDAELSVPIFMVRAVLRKPKMQRYVTPLDLPEELLTRAPFPRRAAWPWATLKWPSRS